MLYRFIRLATYFNSLKKDEHLYESTRPFFEHQMSVDPSMQMRSLERRSDGKYVDAKVQDCWLSHIEDEARADRHA